MDRLKGKVAIVTGSAMGIGEATAVLFAKEGAKVAITDINEEAGNKVVERIKAEGGEAAFWKLNVANEANCKEVVNAVAEKWGKLDVLVNNAGVVGVEKTTEELSEEEIDFVLNVDVKGVFFMNKYSIPHMRKNGKGSIINISSIYGLVGSDENTPYHAAKGAVTILTKRDAICFGPDHIRVNSVHPGDILTPLLFNEYKDSNPNFMEEKLKYYCLGYLGQPEDVAYTNLFLASDESKFITGAAISVDGGYTAK